MEKIATIVRTMGRDCPAIHLRQASRLLARIYDDAFRPLGLELSQLPVVATVVQRGDSGISVGELARTLVLDRTTVTRAIRPLEQAGFLQVARSPVDARSKVVVATRAGERVVRAAYPLWQRTTKRVREVFGAARIDELNAALAALVAVGPRLGPKRTRR
jgi:DNA-binding MarR family transcriptional regulator